MPNHCQNFLYCFSNSKRELDEVMDFVGLSKPNPYFDFDCVIPYPKIWKEMDSAMNEIQKLEYGSDMYKTLLRGYEKTYNSRMDGYNSGGYEWCTKNWSTKWNAYEVKIDDIYSSDYMAWFKIRFQTAWSPPEKVIVELSKRFPNVEFQIEYFEQGSGYAGGFRCYSNFYEYEKRNDLKIGDKFNDWYTSDYKGGMGG